MSLSFEQINAYLAWKYPTIAYAVSLSPGGSTFSINLWLDRSTNQPSPVTQPTLAAIVADYPNMPNVPPPDWTGFLKWIAATFDAPTVNRFASGYSEFFGYCQFGHATNAQWCLTNGKVKLAADGQPVLSATNYALFQQANFTYHLGMVLP